MAVDMSNYEGLGPLHETFRRQAKATPERIAIVAHDGKTVTFQELDEWTDVLAQQLCHLGVTLNSNVGIYMERCVHYAVSYIAILKAGGAYMPIDVSYPSGLLEDILKDSKPAAICVQEDMLENLKDYKNVVVMRGDWLELVRAEVKKRPSLLLPEVSLDDLAYTVYSSGTTGKPKGIQCPHRGAVFSYHYRHEAFPYTPNDREAANVFFTWEMLRPILKGTPLYIIPDNVIFDPKLLCQFVAKHTITRMLFTPSLLEAVLDSEKEAVTASFASLGTIIFCGEVVTMGLLERCIKLLPNSLFINLYSISEAHDVACSDLSHWYKENKDKIGSTKFCPVGKLLPGVHVVILDSELNPQPVGVPGEIYVGGPTLARGYLNRPELNAARFIRRPINVPVSMGERLYKAGDWGYMLSDGSFEICGRCDSMVKVRGYSIEIQAVEVALLELPIVKACVVVVMGEEGRDKYLVAYIVPQGSVTKKEIRAALKKRLPFYMIPSYFVLLSSIPIVAASGKLDKKALPAVDKTETVDSEGMPSSETEKALMPLWAEVLQLNSVDVQESFFDLGGHSLLATKLLSKVSETFNLELCVRDLFTYSTVSLMAKFIDSKKKGTGKVEETIERVDLIKEVQRHDQAVLSMDIQLRAFWRSMRYSDRWRSARVLLTGATGFLGAFLLRDLLQYTETHVYCLVREQPDHKATRRIEKNLEQFGILAAQGVKGTVQQELLGRLFHERVTGVKGDVGLVSMGLEEDEYTYLCTDIDFIIHAAACVNLIYPYQALHGPNVLGTQNVLLFACTSKIKPLHYISTDAVYPHGLNDVSEQHNMTSTAHLLSDGYSQSKWVAEQLVLKAMERGLPATVYRLGNQSGDRENGHWNPQDFTLLMLQGVLFSGSAPKMEWDVEFTPVDFVSKLIVTLTQKSALGLGKVFNVINTQPIKSQWLFEWITAHGYPLKFLHYKEWAKGIQALTMENKDLGMLQRILDTMIEDESFFSNLTKYKNDELQKVLKVLELPYPEINSKLLETYFKALAKRSIFPRIRRNTMVERPLEGKVAIVTGASSGIGAAISRCLARGGARVAMAARREDKLEEVRTAIQDDGDVAICVKCDVTDRTMVGEMVKHVETALGPVDILVNNAGIMYYTMMKNLQEDQWNHQIDINCKGVVNCVGAVLESMLKRKQGHIINMSSDAGRRGFAGLAVYSGTKFFVEGLSQGMRHEFSSQGIKVTCIQPGDVKSELISHTTDMEAKEAFDGSGSTQILEPEDIGRAVLFAATQPPYAAVNEILIEPREAPI